MTALREVGKSPKGETDCEIFKEGTACSPNGEWTRPPYGEGQRRPVQNSCWKAVDKMKFTTRSEVLVIW